MTAAAADVHRAPVVEESLASKVLRFVAKTPVHLLLAFIGLLWLIPTIGLFLTSLLPAADFAPPLSRWELTLSTPHDDPCRKRGRRRVAWWIWA